MSKGLKIGLGIILLGLGIVILVSISTEGRFFYIDETQFTYHEVTYDYDVFAEIKLGFSNRSVKVLPSDTNEFKLVYYVHERETHTESTDNKRLELKIEMKWYNSFFTISSFSNQNYYLVEMYVPQEDIKYNLDIGTSNGAINIDDLSVFEKIQLTSSNGELALKNINSPIIDLKTSNGRIDLNNVTSTTNIKGVTSNGRVNLQDVTSPDMNFTTSNGRIIGNNLNCNNLRLVSSNGDIEANVIGVSETYRVRLSTSNGDKIYNGIKVSQSDFNTDQSNYINISSSNGNVSLSFIN